MMMIPEISKLPGQIEAALQFLRLAEEIVTPRNFGGPPEAGRDLSRTEFEVKDSALTVLLEYFNQPVLPPDHQHPAQASAVYSKPDILP